MEYTIAGSIDLTTMIATQTLNQTIVTSYAVDRSNFAALTIFVMIGASTKVNLIFEHSDDPTFPVGHREIIPDEDWSNPPPKSFDDHKYVFSVSWFGYEGLKRYIRCRTKVNDVGNVSVSALLNHGLGNPTILDKEFYADPNVEEETPTERPTGLLEWIGDYDDDQKSDDVNSDDVAGDDQETGY